MDPESNGNIMDENNKISEDAIAASNLVALEREASCSEGNKKDPSNNLNIVISDSFTLNHTNVLEKHSNVVKQISNDNTVHDDDDNNIKIQTRDEELFSTSEYDCNKSSNQDELTGNKSVISCPGGEHSTILSEDINIEYNDLIKPCSVVIENNLANSVKPIISDRLSRIKTRNRLNKRNKTEKGKTTKNETLGMTTRNETSKGVKLRTGRISKFKFLSDLSFITNFKRIRTKPVKKCVRDFTILRKQSVNIYTKSKSLNTTSAKNTIKEHSTKNTHVLVTDKVYKNNHQSEPLSSEPAGNVTSMLITDKQGSQQADVSNEKNTADESPLSSSGNVTNDQFLSEVCEKIQHEQDLVKTKVNQKQAMANLSPPIDNNLLNNKKDVEFYYHAIETGRRKSWVHDAGKIIEYIKQIKKQRLEESLSLNSVNNLNVQNTPKHIEDETQNLTTGMQEPKELSEVQLDEMKSQELSTEKSSLFVEPTEIKEETVFKMRQKISLILEKESHEKCNVSPSVESQVSRNTGVSEKTKTKKRKRKIIGLPNQVQTKDTPSPTKTISLQPNSDLKPNPLLSINKQGSHHNSDSDSDSLPLITYDKRQHVAKQKTIASNSDLKSSLAKINKLKQISWKALPTAQKCLENISSCNQRISPQSNSDSNSDCEPLSKYRKIQTKQSKPFAKHDLNPVLGKTNILEKRLRGSLTSGPMPLNNSSTFLSNSPFGDRSGLLHDDCFPINCKSEELLALPMSADLVDCLDGAPPFIREIFKCENIRDGFINADLVFVLSLLPDMEEMTDAQKIHFQLKVIEMLNDVMNDKELSKIKPSKSKCK